MIFFLFMAAQVYSARGGVPVETISLVLRMRWKRARREGRALPPSRIVDISFYYFALCILSASIHPGENTSFFWGVTVLMAWALWTPRSPRFGPAIWASCLAAAMVVGYFGQKGAGQLQRYLETINPQWFARFTRPGFDPTQSRTSIGQLGRIKESGKIVIRVQTKKGEYPPPLLREASYRAYKNQTWFATDNRTSYETIFEDQTNRAQWVLVPGKKNLETVTIGCYLPGGNGLLPIPTGTGELNNLSAFTMQRNPMGALMAQGPGLIVFNAEYGPGPTMDSPADPVDDLYVPDWEGPALEKIIEELELTGKTRGAVLRKLDEFFGEKFTYSTYQTERWSRSQESPISRFLLKSRKGHCEYYATASVLILRKLGFEARYAVGYAVHEKSGDNKYVVRLRDAHAWVLVWNADRRTWTDYDPTPGLWVEQESARASSFQRLSDFWENVRFQVAKFRWGQTNLRSYLLWTTVPVLTVLFIQVVFRRRSRMRDRDKDLRSGFVWPGMDSEIYELEKRVARRGLPRRPSEPLSDWLKRAAREPGLSDVRDRLVELLSLHYRYRFDPHGLSAEERDRLRLTARECLARV
jgi:hypothetical protein